MPNKAPPTTDNPNQTHARHQDTRPHAHAQSSTRTHDRDISPEVQSKSTTPNSDDDHGHITHARRHRARTRPRPTLTARPLSARPDRDTPNERHIKRPLNESSPMLSRGSASKPKSIQPMRHILQTKNAHTSRNSTGRGATDNRQSGRRVERSDPTRERPTPRLAPQCAAHMG